MLKSRLIPTPLVDSASVSPITIVPTKKLGRFSSLTLVARLLGFAMGMFWGNLLRRGTPAERAVQTREFLESLGGMWIKAGQLISLRTDLLSREMANELSQLTYLTNGFEPDIARQVVEDELGRPIEDVFDVWDAHPFAAASISQVHRARLRSNGVWVAVKVQRPGIKQVFARDLKLISRILRMMKRMPGLGFITWDGMIRELERMMTEEVDYRYETANLRRMRKLLKDHKVYVPKIYRKASTRRILTMEYITGVLMTDYLRAHRDDPARLKAWCKENNVKPFRVGSRLMRSFYRQLFEDNLFHGDLHPGNIILLRNSRFCLIDFGTIGNLEARFVRTYGTLVRFFSQGEYTKAVDAYLQLSDSIPVFDLTEYRVEMVEVMREWEARSHLEGLSYYERSFTGGAAVQLSDIARKYKVNPNWQFLRVARSLNTMDANVSALLGNANPNKIARRYFREAARRKVAQLRKQAFRTIYNSASEITESASYVSDSLRRQAIMFQGAQTKVAYFLSVLFSIARLVLIGIGLMLLYDYLHDHDFQIVASINAEVGILRDFAVAFPAYAASLGILVLLVMVGLILFTTRVRRRLAAPSVRLPNGQLDS